jgi:imidazolonepropionase-like amidohydrolase
VPGPADHRRRLGGLDPWRPRRHQRLPRGRHARVAADLGLLRRRRLHAARCASRCWLGADIIKITATGGVLSNTAAGLAQQFSDAELAAIVDAAHRMGRQGHRPRPRRRRHQQLPAAGGDSIEHGTYLDAESHPADSRSDGVYLVPTLMAGDFVAASRRARTTS